MFALQIGRQTELGAPKLGALGRLYDSNKSFPLVSPTSTKRGRGHRCRETPSVVPILSYTASRSVRCRPDAPRSGEISVLADQPVK